MPRLQRVNKLRILLIRQIKPPIIVSIQPTPSQTKYLLLILQLHILWRGPNLRFLLILQHAVTMDKRQYPQTNAPAHNDRNLGGYVARRVAWAKGLWACPG
jgi:hypothetical protein